MGGRPGGWMGGWVGGCCADMVALANMGKGGQADADPCRPELPAIQNSSTQGRSARAATHSRHSPRVLPLSMPFPPASPTSPAPQGLQPEAFCVERGLPAGCRQAAWAHAPRLHRVPGARMHNRWVGGSGVEWSAWRAVGCLLVWVSADAGAARLPLQGQLAPASLTARPSPPSPPPNLQTSPAS